MTVCFPVESDMGLESRVYGHFGSAPMFIICDTESGGLSQVDNRDERHEHGRCSPIKALDGHSVDAVVVGGIGAGAIGKLNALDIKVFRAEKTTVKENLELIRNSALPEISMDSACGRHGGCGSNESPHV